jgi:hypothetical protein
MPAEGIFHNLVFVSIDKQYPGQAYKVMNAMWGQGLMSLAKVIVVLDKEVNVRNVQEAWWVALNHIDPERDVRFSMGPIDVLDHSSRAFTYGSKMGIDATRKWPEEGFTRNWPKLIEMDAETKKQVDGIWAKLGCANEGPIKGKPVDARGQPVDLGHRREGQTLRGLGTVSAPRESSCASHTQYSRCHSRSSERCWRATSPITPNDDLGRRRLTTARFAAMGFNRIVDREIDARNPARGPGDSFGNHGRARRA